VLGLPQPDDPVGYITKRVREVIFDAVEAGWSGPPFDPFTLAEHLNLSVVPRDDILDARTVPLESDRLQIEFNPNRPNARVRFSIAHEIAHTFFPDCKDRVRNRARREHMEMGEWQLEMLCNIAAAELLMPIGTFPDLREKRLSIDSLMDLRRQYDVSTEAILLRFVRLTDIPCMAFCVSRSDPVAESSRYRVDYTIGSKQWSTPLPSGTILPEQTVVRECTGIGFTAKGKERWPGIDGSLHIEAVGIPPYPKHHYPRVVGITRLPDEHPKTHPKITYLRGDATRPRGDGLRIICHVVNDTTPRWGGGFALVIRRRFPEVQEDFNSWVQQNRGHLSLGNARLRDVDDALAVFSVVCQKGYGHSRKPRVRYTAMKTCLDQLAELALSRAASIHMPRIGCGQAGGSWHIVSELIDEALCRQGISVTVYDLPNAEPTPPASQPTLFEG
jgi:O-acetyl-ADP-ribose deacetylase (regulator of RNase III)